MYRARLSDPGESVEGMAGRQARGGHLPAQTEFEWDKPDLIPVFVPVTGQIPGLSDSVIAEANK